MRLRRITFISIAIVTLVFLAIEAWVANSVVKDGFDSLERGLAAAEARRVRNGVLREIQALDSFVWDWASWDDTYHFASNGNPEYIESNLPAETFSNQALCAVVITDAQGRIVFGRALDQDGRDDGALLADLVAAIHQSDLPAASPGVEETGRGGLLLRPEGAVFFVRREILDSQGGGPSTGQMLMARRLGDAVRQALSQRLELEVVFHPLEGGRLAPDMDGALAAGLLSDEGTAVLPRDAGIMDAYALVRDIQGLPGLVVQAVCDRAISKKGREVAHLNFMILASALVAFGLLVFYLLRRKVLSRVESLNSQVRALDMTGAGGVHIDGRDEIAELARDINAMLAQIVESRQALQAAHDDLERRVAERTTELEEANRELKWLDQAKSHFLSSTSHELRTPLTSILGFVKLMERTFRESFGPSLEACDQPSERIAKHLQNFRIVRTEAERLSRLINDLLDFSKITAGRMDWQECDVRTDELVRDAVAAISGQLAGNPNLELVADAPAGLPVLHVSRDRILQVLINLLGNAVKHTEAGHIRVSARTTGDGVEFSVEDTGIGIHPDDRERIFEVFFQSSRAQAPSSRPVGTGLGLAICKEIAEHYGGSIRVESEPGRGSVFTFSLPGSLVVAS
ncbi:HAMP domain-containing protein [Pseudodesulfovibrio sp. F-1]|uniref:histidine kinase n=1 Tax=Pseudodesulfovibrio alkaliphilus TaxID=2661613 RepID=A0A7K1KRR7_9BACT|nr:ATP-binding protein [Pseudodesulfovibrio alkaliphilus]MUM78764.1 HAMP domain-containing protein [Pseudodesulfovibrio alkaliphilus]